MEFKHIPVMLDECIAGLNIKPDGIYVDGTAGGAGHSSQIARRLTTGRLIAIDRDPDAVKIAKERLYGLNATVVHDHFGNIDDILKDLGI
ncbi:MAG TPA: 16S rRNA (cytosine(1402)-N(4))-methyltransferase, partial [Clostridiales bacterium]|nr:16S rRNA (cytosine(1402)-N(4))-methyltransferase [Clostridiales bacterium]